MSPHAIGLAWPPRDGRRGGRVDGVSRYARVVKTPARTAPGAAPRTAEALALHRSSWAPVLVARAALGLASVLVVTEAADGAVAVVSPAEASAWLKQRGEARASARVVGTATPGSVWVVSVSPDGVAVTSAAMAPYLAG